MVWAMAWAVVWVVVTAVVRPVVRAVVRAVVWVVVRAVVRAFRAVVVGGVFVGGVVMDIALNVMSPAEPSSAHRRGGRRG